jgi:Leucine-rich repeat (LRR) protein
MRYSGTLTEAIGDLRELEVLSLASNRIAGHIPESLYSCTSLRHLDLSNNCLRHLISPLVGHLTRLIVLNLSGNTIEGPLPDALKHLSSLRYCSIFRSCHSEATASSTQFDLLKFQHLCDFESKFGIDCFTSSAEAVFGHASTVSELDEEVSLKLRLSRW